MRRATATGKGGGVLPLISIHALLAESDCFRFWGRSGPAYFNPRSPCGERPQNICHLGVQNNFNPRSPCGERPSALRRCASPSAFQSTLSLRRATWPSGPCSPSSPISIHALLAESDLAHGCLHRVAGAFQSTLSLRRATSKSKSRLQTDPISIHALLAESDQCYRKEVSGK